jgi:PAS domain S-box-containing protein
MGVSEPLIQAPLLGEAIENGPAAVFVADEDGSYVAVNKAACVLLGYSREELLQLGATDVARYPEAGEEWAGMQKSGMRVGTAELTRKDGSTLTFSYIAGVTMMAGLQVYVSVGAAV